MFGGIFGKPDPAKLAEGERIRRVVRAHLGLDDDATVSVNEIACGDPACPGGIETVILVRLKGRPMRAAKLPGGFHLATEAAVRAALDEPRPG